MKFNNIYNIDFQKLLNLLTPAFLRKPVFIDWMISIVKPLEDVYFLFKGFRKTSIYKVTHNGQVYSMQAVLNDSYDKTLRRIRVVDALIHDPLYIYPEADTKPVYIYTEAENKDKYVYDDSIYEDIDFDFIVLIPIEYKPINPQDENNFIIQVRSLINYYKLASKRYKIVWT